MDFVEPVQAIIPGATGRVLSVLLHTSRPLSGRGIAQLAGVSPAQAARVLPRLVELGLVRAEESPPAILYTLATDHVAAGPLQMLTRAAPLFVQGLSKEIAELRPRPAGVAVFGSLARHQAHMGSDIDILVVRPCDREEDDKLWRSVVDAIRTSAHELSGNRVEILEEGQREMRRLVSSRSPLWREIVRDALVIHGPPLDEL